MNWDIFHSQLRGPSVEANWKRKKNSWNQSSFEQGQDMVQTIVITDKALLFLSDVFSIK